MRDVRVAVFLAARSFARGNASVTVMTVLMIAVVFISTMFLPSLLSGAVVTINDQVRQTMTSDLIITPVEDATINHAAGYLSEVAELDEVQAVTGVRRVGTQIAFGEESNAWGVDAIDPVSFAKVFTTPEHLVEGDFLKPDDRHGIVLGIDIAGVDDTGLRAYSTSLKSVHVGDRVDVTLTTGEVKKFTVRGIYRNRFPLSDQGAYITTAAADRLEPSADYADSVEKLYEAVDDLGSALDEAADGVGDLAEGSAAVARSAHKVAESAEALATGADDVEAGVSALASGAGDLERSAAQVADGAAILEDATAKLDGQMDSTVEPLAQDTASDASTAADAAARLAASCPAAVVADYCAQVSGLASSLTGLTTEATGSATAVDSAGSSIAKLDDSAGELASGAGALAKATSRLSRSADSVKGGAQSLTASASKLASGANKLAASADSMSRAAGQVAQQLRTSTDTVPEIDKDERDDLLDALAQAGEGPARNSATRVYVLAAPGASSAELEDSIDPLRAGMQFQTPDQVASAIQDQIDSFTLINNIMRVISLVVAAITVFILTYVELTNRRRQIGIERAIGIGSSAIVGSYVIKSAINAVTGILVGAAVFTLLIVPLVGQHPFPFPNGDVTLATEATTTRANIRTLLIVAIAAALVPAIHTVRMKILDAIWGR